MGARSTLRVADDVAMCWPALSPSTASHDEGVRHTARNLLHGLLGDEGQQGDGPSNRHSSYGDGGLGHQSASRTAPAAHWASWADALHTIDQLLPEVSHMIVELFTPGEATGSLGGLQRATRSLDRDGFVTRPSWENLQDGRRCKSPELAESCEWKHVFLFGVSLSEDGGSCPVMPLLAWPLGKSQKHKKTQEKNAHWGGDTFRRAAPVEETWPPRKSPKHWKALEKKAKRGADTLRWRRADETRPQGEGHPLFHLGLAHVIDQGIRLVRDFRRQSCPMHVQPGNLPWGSYWVSNFANGVQKWHELELGVGREWWGREGREEEAGRRQLTAWSQWAPSAC